MGDVIKLNEFIEQSENILPPEIQHELYRNV